MKFRCRRTHYQNHRLVETGAIVGVGAEAFCEWDGALNDLLEPLDDEAKAEFVRLRLGKREIETPETFGEQVPTVAHDPATDIYRTYGVELTRTGYDPKIYRKE